MSGRSVDGPRLFHISPDGCGEEVIAGMFRASGLRVALCEQGRLAEDVLYAQGRDAPLLAPWDGVDLVAGLWRLRPAWRPSLEAWRSFAFLASRFPKARFLLTTRRAEDWAQARMLHDGGAAARAYACQLGCAPDDLPRRWARAFRAHRRAVVAHFADDPRLILLDLDRQGPEQLAQLLQDVAALAAAPPADWGLRGGLAPPAAVTRHCPLPRPDPAPAPWGESVADFCLAGLDPADGAFAGALRMGGLSNLACHWDGIVRAGRASVAGRDGAPRQFAVFRAPGGPLALARSGRHFKLVRAEGVINDMLRLGRRLPVWIDMEDSRWMGSPEGAPIDRPVLCHNRRAGARNAVLWPLPDQHGIGMPSFDPDAPPDGLAFEDKLDRVVWRGMISGSEMRAGVKPGAASHVWLTRLAQAEDPQDRAFAWEGLCRTNRLAFIRRFIDDPDFDIGIVMAPAFRDFAADPLLAPYCRPREGAAFFRRFRYQLCMTGYDHGSNFISGLDQNGVLLAEEDGWQVFYSGRFRPWEHYIPVARYLTDLPQMLDWARANPAECKAISARARAELRHLRDRAARDAAMRLILDGLAAAR